MGDNAKLALVGYGVAPTPWGAVQMAAWAAVTVVLVIECKKAQGRRLAFLRPVGSQTTGLVKMLTVWHLQQPQGAGSRSGIDLRDDIHLEPASYRSEFCVSTDGDKDKAKRPLEPDAPLVALAAEALAADGAMYSLLPASALHSAPVHRTLQTHGGATGQR